MSWFPLEQRLRDAVLEAMIPAPSEGMPAMADLDRAAFWARFEETAPVHLQLAMRVAAVTLGAVLPRAMGNARSLDALSTDARERVLLRASRLPVLCDLLEITKIVACLAYFADDGVQSSVRGVS